MRATEVLADPLAEVTGRLLTVPARHLYAYLWRVGLLEVQHGAPARSKAEVRPLRSAG